MKTLTITTAPCGAACCIPECGAPAICAVQGDPCTYADHVTPYVCGEHLRGALRESPKPVPTIRIELPEGVDVDVVRPEE